MFGKAQDKGLKLAGWEPAIVPAAEADTWKADVASPGPAFAMAQLQNQPGMPRPIGVFRSVNAPLFDHDMNEQVKKAVAKRGKGTLKDLVYSGEMWTVT